MLKLLLKFLIPPIATVLLASLYLLFEPYIFELLTIEPNTKPPILTIRILLSILSLCLLSLTYWIILLYDKIKAKNKEIDEINNDIQDLLKDNETLKKQYAEKRKGKIKYKSLYNQLKDKLKKKPK